MLNLIVASHRNEDTKMGLVLLTTAFRPAPGPTQRPYQWVPGTLSPGSKASGA